MQLEIMQRIKKMMLVNGFKVSVAESLTTGNVQSILGSVSGSSDFYEGGITAYQREHKVKYLHVDEPHAKEVNCVSPRVAREMAQGVCKMFSTHIGIATTGYAENPSDDPRFSAPTAYVAIYVDYKGTASFVYEDVVCGGDLSRTEMQKKVVRKAIEGLHAYLSKLPDASAVSQLQTDSQ
jgi:PncC family amidohydrolase